MELPTITNIGVNWYHGYANSPQLEITVDRNMPKFEEWIFQATTDYKVDPVMLISQNFDPWVKFVYISDRNGNPSLNGALGGKFKLTTGEVLESRSGWSSRAGVINKSYQKFIPGAILEPTVLTPDGFRWAGFAILAKYVGQHELWPEGIYLVPEVSNSSELTFTPSVDPNVVVKIKNVG